MLKSRGCSGNTGLCKECAELLFLGNHPRVPSAQMNFNSRLIFLVNFGLFMELAEGKKNGFAAWLSFWL